MAAWLLPAFIASTAVSFHQQRAASKDAKRARAAQQRVADVKAAKERSALLREARVRRARLANMAAQGGLQDASGAISGQQMVSQSAMSNVSFLDTVSRLGQESNYFLQQSADATSRSSAWAQLGSIASSAATMRGDWEALGKSSSAATTRPINTPWGGR